MFQLRDYQTKIIQETRQLLRAGVRSVLIQSPTGSGKCLGKGTIVLMYDGTVRPVEDINIGDLLMGPDSKSRMVISITKGIEPLYKIIPIKGNSYIVNESHILSLKRTETGEIVNISVKDYLLQSKDFKHLHKGWRASVIDFPQSNKNLLLPSYFLGLWLGDGHSHKTAITTGDKEIKEYLIAFAKEMKLSIRVEENSLNSEIINIIHGKKKKNSPNKIKEILKYYNLLHNKHIPHRYKTANIKNRLELLAGIIDTDGYYDGNGCYQIISKSDRLADDIAFVARSLGFAAYISKLKKTCHNNGKTGVYNSISLSGHTDLIPSRLKRKQATKRKQKKNHLVHGIRVESVGIGEYYGFELSFGLNGQSNLFLLGDFTVTHNTALTAHMLGTSSSKGIRSFFICHRIELIRQSMQTFDAVSIPYGIEAADFPPDRGPLVQIASIQTLARRLSKVKTPKLIVWDECQHIASKSWSSVHKNYPDAIHIGLTATSQRLDGKGLGDWFTHMVQGPCPAELIRLGYLSPYKAYAPSTVDVSGLHVRMGDYAKDELAKAVDKPAIIGDAVSHYKRLAMGKRAIVFCASIEHSHHVVSQFRAAGIPAEHVDGETDRHIRSDAMKRFQKGQTWVISNVDLFAEGVDVPAMEAVIQLRPTQSLSLHLQQLGRGMRPAEGKSHLIILDHVGNLHRHGLPDDDREWSLDGRGKSKQGQNATPVRTCPKCYAVVRAAVTKCQYCGHIFEIEGREIEEREGELVEIDPEQLRRERLREQGQVKGFDALVALGKKRGYKRPYLWARFLWNARQAKQRRT